MGYWRAKKTEDALDCLNLRMMHMLVSGVIKEFLYDNSEIIFSCSS